MNDYFLFLLVTTVLLRGLGAGIIIGAELMTLPLRRRLDLVSYARFMREYYKGSGVKVYAAITIFSFILLLMLSLWTFARGDAAGIRWSIFVSLLATILGFVGTAGAYPAMRKLWGTSDTDAKLVADLLDRFARWGIVSALSHVVAFIFIAIALANTV